MPPLLAGLLICIHYEIEAQGTAQLTKVAMASTVTSLTYGDLDRIATQIASDLNRHGVFPGVIVPLCFDKSPWMIVAMLGVLKAGEAFFALDSKAPTSRINVMMHQVNAKVVATETKHRHLFSNCQVIELSDTHEFILPQTIDNYPTTRPSHHNDAAYLVFTSGSTGGCCRGWREDFTVQHQLMGIFGRSCSGSGGVNIPVSCFMDQTARPTLIANHVRSAQEQGQGEYKLPELNLKIALDGLKRSLDVNITTAPARSRLSPGSELSTLLTGRAGYLGQEILNRLLTAGQRVIVLVRACSISEGRKRFQTLPWCASDLWSVNVDATVALLQLPLSSSSVQRFVYVSGGSAIGQSVDEWLANARDGYSKTKLMAHALVQHCAIRSADLQLGLDIWIVKPGFIIGGPEKRVANSSDYLWRNIAWRDHYPTDFHCVEPEAWGNDIIRDSLQERDIWEVLAERTKQWLLEEGPDRIVDVVAADVLKGDQVETLVDAVVKKHGHIDILINNVGETSVGNPATMSEKLWNFQLDVNSTSVFRLCHYVVPIMEKQGSGNIINKASMTTLRYICKYQIAYLSCKAAAIRFTKALGAMYAKNNNRSNCVVIGLMYTPLVDNFAQRKDTEDQEALKPILDHSCSVGWMGRGTIYCPAMYWVILLAAGNARTKAM
ncbi:hypothetical protein FANTH_13947 [Fusarium anthophilum]|uniref:AMP-dependent synthetase/ligase domain-containing protein n=1 Tax=Fusarium anthophilum TaxID=48485 RepID=A0A8H4YL20_9HYPO|nr:hypothetical protein FANTH_13947 [Fusarium anthophilum]